jgi:hypothetical protein
MNVQMKWALLVVTAVVALLVILLFAPLLLSGTHPGNGHSHTEPVRLTG